MTTPNVQFGHDVPTLDAMSDEEFLQALRWNRNAPPPLVKCAAAGDVARFTRRLAQRRCVARRGAGGKRVAKISEQRPALWSASAFDDSQRRVELAALWDAIGRGPTRGKAQGSRIRENSATTNGSWSDCERRLGEWLDAAAAVPMRGFELLILLEMLPAIGRGLAPALRWKLWRTALTAALRLPGDGEGGPVLLDGGELPFRAGLLFGGIKSAAKLRRAGATVLAEALADAVDDDGVPAADLVERLPLFLASFVRTRQWAAAFNERPWNAETQRKLDRCIRAVTPLCRADGRLALSNGDAVPAVPILQAAASVAGFGRKSRPVRFLAELDSAAGNGRAGRGKKASRTLQKSSRKLAGVVSPRNRPAMQSDASRLACLRTDWSPAAAVLAVAHDGALPRVDLSVAGVPVLNGVWEVELSAKPFVVTGFSRSSAATAARSAEGGEPHRLAEAGHDEPVSGDWDCTCWFSDRDVDFIELQHKAGRGVLIDRQVLLSRDGEFAVFVDCVTGESGKPLMYRSRLPVEIGTQISSDTATRELRCKRPGMTVRCYPLSLPCDPVHGAAGRFDDVDGRLQLMQSAVGGLVAPVVLDWSAGRRKQQAEWRQLTVAADGQRVPPENAAGYRLRVGNLHLIAYRSLRQTDESRTVLGMHTRHETVVGRFTKDGSIDPLLLVE